MYLCSPVTAAASAVTGVITDPREAGAFADARYPASLAASMAGLLPPAASGRCRERTTVIKGPNIKDVPRGRPVPESLTAPVLIVLGDKVSTDDISPSGTQSLMFRTNVPAISEFCFRNVDPTFVERAKAAGVGIIVGGELYGQGSSREAAVLSPLHLGIRAVLAKSFARIHRANLINWGIAPLEFDDPAEHGGIERDDASGSTGCATLSRPGEPVAVTNERSGRQLRARCVLTPRERDILLAGGLLAQTAANAGGTTNIGPAICATSDAEANPRGLYARRDQPLPRLPRQGPAGGGPRAGPRAARRPRQPRSVRAAAQRARRRDLVPLQGLHHRARHPPGCRRGLHLRAGRGLEARRRLHRQLRQLLLVRRALRHRRGPGDRRVDGVAAVRIHNTNTKKIIVARVPVDRRRGRRGGRLRAARRARPRRAHRARLRRARRRAAPGSSCPRAGPIDERRRAHRLAGRRDQSHGLRARQGRRPDRHRVATGDGRGPRTVRAPRADPRGRGGHDGNPRQRRDTEGRGGGAADLVHRTRRQCL